MLHPALRLLFIVIAMLIIAGIIFIYYFYKKRKLNKQNLRSYDISVIDGMFSTQKAIQKKYTKI